MRYFNTMAESSFKISPEGETLFYPNGALSKGRVVPDEETKLALFNFQITTYKLTVFLAIPYGWVLGMVGIFTISSFSPIVIMALYILYKQHCLVRGLEKHHLRLGFKEAVQKGSNALPNWYYWLSAIISIGMVTLSLYLPALCNKPFLDFILPVIGLASLGVLGLALSIKLYQLKNTANDLCSKNNPKLSFVQNINRPSEPTSKPKSSKIILLLTLATVIVFTIYIKASNPNKKYSTEEFWFSATIDNVAEIPNEAMLPDNKNGSVLMWAAIAVNAPKIISALINRGSDVNEADVIFSGTPLSAAAAYNSNPAIIDELIIHGAIIDKVVGSNDKTPLIIAAELNPNPEIIDRLIYHGSDVNYKDKTGRTALQQAIRFKNNGVIETLKMHTKKSY